MPSGKRTVSGSMTGGLKETQEMLDLCGEHNITCDIELVSTDRINEALARLARNDVRSLRDRHWRGLKLKLLLYCVWIIMLKIKLELHAFFLEWIGESIFLFTHEKRIVMMHLPHVPELRINSCLILSIC